MKTAEVLVAKMGIHEGPPAATKRLLDQLLSYADVSANLEHMAASQTMVLS